MKLHNKKTGQIGDFMGTYNAVPFFGIGIDYHDGNPVKYEYRSLTELNEEWEDYTPAEPLIKDEKIRKAVKAWAEAVGKSDDLIEFDESAGSLWCNRSRIQFDNTELKGLKNWQKYTIAELCGEEEE